MSNTPTSLPTGKLPAELLAQLISTLPIDDPALFLGPGVGEDAAIIDTGRISAAGSSSTRGHGVCADARRKKKQLSAEDAEERGELQRQKREVCADARQQHVGETFAVSRRHLPALGERQTAIPGREEASNRTATNMPRQDGADMLLAAKSDPITFATDEIGYYAVNVCANDLAVCGARPRFYLPTVLLPEGTTEVDVREICDQLGAACRALDIVVAGGHTEVTTAVNQPVVAGTLLGEVARGKVVRTGGCRPGDVVLLVGSAGVEGTSIIAREMRGKLLEQGWSEAELDEAANYLYEPGISVLGPALAAAESERVTAMHDPTEGGVATGLWELADASGCGLEVELAAIAVTPLTAAACAAFGLDPLGTIASGGLLATAAPENVDALQGLWQEMGRQVQPIGRVLPAGEGVYGLRDGRRVALERFDADEIVKLWAE